MRLWRSTDFVLWERRQKSCLRSYCGKELKLILLSGVFLLCLFGYGVGRIYGFILYPDEFGYWASAAKAIGYDWKDVASLGSYYSYGYSLLLIPVLLLIPDPVLSYRVAVGLNVLLLFLTLVFLIQLISKLIPDTEPFLGAVFAAVAAFYPTWLFYMQTTLAEIAVVFTFVLANYLLCLYLEQEKTWELLLFIVVIVYLYSLHMRTVAVLIAAVMVFLVRFVRESVCKRQFLNKKMTGIQLGTGLVALALALSVNMALKNAVQETVYIHASGEVMAVNDYAGQWDKIRSLLTWEGIGEFAVSFIGKVYYLGIASFGLFYRGMFYVIKKLLHRNEKNWYFYLFVFLAAVGEILINAVYTKGYWRIDALFYGRYDEQVLPVLMMLGMYQLWQDSQDIRKSIRNLAGMAVSGLLVTGIMEWVITSHNLTNLHEGYFMAGMSYLLHFTDFEPATYFWKAYVFGIIGMAVLFGVAFFARKQKEMEWILLIVVVIQMFLGILLNEQYTYSYNSATYRNTQLAEVLKKGTEEGRRIVSYGNSGDDAFISAIQFLLRDQVIILVPEGQEEKLSDTDMVIVSDRPDETGFLEDKYTQKGAYGSFWLYYTELGEGERLSDETYHSDSLLE